MESSTVINLKNDYNLEKNDLSFKISPEVTKEEAGEINTLIVEYFRNKGKQVVVFGSLIEV